MFVTTKSASNQKAMSDFFSSLQHDQTVLIDNNNHNLCIYFEKKIPLVIYFYKQDGEQNGQVVIAVVALETKNV